MSHSDSSVLITAAGAEVEVWVGAAEYAHHERWRATIQVYRFGWATVMKLHSDKDYSTYKEAVQIGLAWAEIMNLLGGRR